MIERAVCPVLVGRDSELSALEDALVEASLGTGSIVVVQSDAGLGKTRLATELRKRAQRIGCATVWGDCRESELSLPFLPVIEALAQHLTPAVAVEVQRRLGPTVRELAPLLPAFGPPIALRESGDPGQSRLRLYEAVLALLRVLTLERPLLMVIEDLQWADPATRGLLDFLARPLGGLPLLVLATVRSDDLHRGHPVTALLQAWRRGGLAQTVELAPLAAAGVSTMVTAALDAPEIGVEFRDYVHARSEGNPFVVEELLKEAIDRRDVYRGDGGWRNRAVAELSLPRAVSETILLRVERLAPSDLAALQAAAVLGRSFAYTTLVSVTGLPAPVVQAVLQTCVHQQLVVEDEQLPGRFRFRHALTREAIYDDMILPRRQELHLRAAAVLRESGAAFAEIAEHLLEGGDVAAALPSCLQAGEDAMAGNAPDAAAKLFERALPHIDDAIERSRLLVRIGEALWRAGDIKRARKFLTEAMAALEPDDDAMTVAHIHVLLGHCEHRFPSPKHYLAAGDLLEGLGPSEDLAAVYTRLAIIEANAMDGSEALKFAELAVRTAEAVGARSQRIWASGAMGAALATLGRVDESLDLMERGREQALARGWHWIARAVSRNILALLCEDLRKPELPEAIRRWRALPGHSDEHEGLAQIFEAEMHAAAGNMQQLEDSIASAAGLVRDFDYQIWQLQLLHLTEADRLDEAARLVGRPDSLEPHSELEVGQRQTFLIELALAHGSSNSALEAAAWAQHTQAANVWAWMSDAAVKALLATEQLADAAAILQSDRHFSGPAREPFLTRARGRLTLAQSRPREAVQQLQAARAAFAERHETRQELWTLLSLAGAHVASGQMEAARACVEEVTTGAEGFGLALLARHARDVARRIGVTLAPAPRPLSIDPRAGAEERAPHGAPGFALAARVAAPGLPQGTPEVAQYLKWADQYLLRLEAMVVSSGSELRAQFNPSSEAADTLVAVRAALALHTKALMAAIPLTLSLVASSSSGAVSEPATRSPAPATPGELILDRVTRHAADRWLAEHPSARPRVIVASEVDLTGVRAPVIGTVADARVENAFVREGEFWSLAFDGVVVRLKDAKGLRDIASLLAVPGREVAAVELAGRGQGSGQASVAAVAALGFGTESDAGDALDAQALAQYRARVLELEDEVNDADSANDPERASRARQEREFVLAELAGAVGLTGRARRTLDPAERARKAVTGRIRDAVANIEALHPSLGRHLRRSLRTGSFCVYDPPEPAEWRL